MLHPYHPSVATRQRGPSEHLEKRYSAHIVERLGKTRGTKKPEPKLGESLGDRILKVNHAGEHGAVNIYRGQRFASRWRNPDLLDGLQELQQHEERHRHVFASELQRRRLHRCRSYQLCGVGGLLLGFITGMCGRRSIAATTVAVEAVVLRHLDGQLRALRDTDPNACQAISSIIEDERALEKRFADAGYEVQLREGGFEDPVPAVLVITDNHGNRVDLLGGVRGRATGRLVTGECHDLASERTIELVATARHTLLQHI